MKDERAASSLAVSGRGEWVERPRRTYDVSSDGHRFVMIKSANAAPTTPTPERIVLVQNWFEEMRAKLRPN